MTISIPSSSAKGSTGTPACAGVNITQNSRVAKTARSDYGSLATPACPELRGGCASFKNTGAYPRSSALFKRSLIASLSLGLLLFPAAKNSRALSLHASLSFAQSAQSQSEADEARREREEEQKERERDRAEEKRDREQERLDRLEELYDDGRESLDDDHYEQALSKFTELVKMNGPQTDAALYWKAYAENKLGKKAAALSTIAEVKSKYPQSRWKKDAEALEIEVKQSSNQQVKPEDHGDDELYDLALQGVMNSSPERGIPMIEARLNKPGPDKKKAKLLFILAQSGQPKAMDILADIARGKSNPELQRKAIEYLSMFGGEKAHKILADVYPSGDENAKRAIIRSYLLSGDKASLFAVAKNEKSESLRREAIRTLGLTGGTSELDQLYKSETSTDLKREILQAFFLAGDSTRMEQAALNEKDAELRRSAIRNLGLMGKSDLLQSIYAKETDYSLKEEVLNSYFISGNAKALVAVAKSEKDTTLKKKAVEKLSLMGSKEGNDYLMEILNK